MNDLVKCAERYIGTKEIVGMEHNPVIVNWSAEIGHNWVQDDETPWCSTFINMVARRMGYEYTGKLNARSWLDVGLDVEEPVEGTIVIFSRGNNPSYGHVGIFMGFAGEDILCLGGNQGNEVKVQVYAKDRVVGYRDLRKLNHKVMISPRREDLSPIDATRIDEAIEEITDVLGAQWRVERKTVSHE